MIIKSGKDSRLVTSYGPISLHPEFFKGYFFQIEKDRFVHQFGFRKQHSTKLQIHRIINQINKAFEAKQYFGRILRWYEDFLGNNRLLLPPSYHQILV